MLVLLHIAGAVALIVYGVRQLRKGLDRLFGARLATWLARVSVNRFRGAGVGALVSVATPSSTTMALLGVQMVKAGSIRFENLWSIMLGATIGLTIMIQLIALNVQEEATLFILVGVVLYLRTRRNITRGIGQVLLALGLIFLAIWQIRLVTSGFDGDNQDFVQLVELLHKYPWGLAILAAILSVALQSSTAALGLLLGLTSGSLLSIDEALPCVVGVNVGVGITIFMFGYNHPDSRRLGLAMLVSKVSVAILLILFMDWLNPLLAWVSPDGIGRQIANAHTGFAVIMALLWLPLVPLIAPLIERVVPDKADEIDLASPIYLRDDYVLSPTMAFGQSMREITRMAELVRCMFEDFWKALSGRNLPLCRSISERDDVVDSLNQHIKDYLIQLGGEDYGRKEAATQVAHLRYAGELENIGDIIDKNLVELVRKRIRTRGVFSDEGFADLKQAYTMVMENYVIADTAFTTQNAELASTLIRHKHNVDRLDAKLRRRHFDRLQKGLAQSVETSAIHLDLLTYLKSINSHLTAVAYPILDQAELPHPAADEDVSVGEMNGSEESADNVAKWEDETNEGQQD